MKRGQVNKVWTLTSSLYPVGYPVNQLHMATDRQMDNVAIYYKNDDDWFRPIVFTDNRVISGTRWLIKDFYKGLGLCLDVHFTKTCKRKRFCIYYHFWDETVKWGCREFTLKDICTMMEIMEYYYTAKELGR